MSTAIAVIAIEPAWAQDASADGAAQEEEVVGDIVVTARRREERQIDVPLSLSVIRGNQLTDGEHLRVEELNSLVPGVNISIPTPRQTSFSIRGLGANPANDGLEQSAGLFLDGVYLAKSGMAVVDLIDVDRIEVLRGPQGTLIGKNTTGGAINIYTKTPSFTPETTLHVSAGNYDYVQLQASASGPVSDTAAVRLTGYGTSREGWVYNPYRDDHTNGQERQGLRAQALFQPHGDIRVRLIGEIHREDDSNYMLVIPNTGATPATFQAGLTATGGEAVISPDGRRASYDSPTTIESTQRAITGLLDWDFGDLALASVIGYREWDYYTMSDIDGTTAPLFRASTDLGYRQFSQEFRLSSRSDTRLNWTLGTYLFQQDTDYASSVYYDSLAASQLTKLNPQTLAARAPSSPTLARLLAYNNSRWDTNATPKTHSYALFGQTTWAATSTVNITAGARATYEKKKMSVWRDAPVSTLNGAVVPQLLSSAYAPVDVDRNDWSPSLLLSVDYKPRAGLMLYALSSHGEKAGGLNATIPATGLGPDSLLVDPEAATNVEAGVKGELLDRKINFTLDTFYTWVSDYQASYTRIPEGGSAPVQLLTNVGKVRTRGVELELSARLSPDLNVGMSGAYIDAFYKSYPNAPCPAGVTGSPSCDLTGQQVAGAPKWMANTHATYERSIRSSAKAYIGGEFSWRSAYFGALDNSPQSRTGNYALTNLRTGLKSADGTWDASLWVKNVFDKSYVLSHTSYGALIPGIYLPYFGDPRTYGMAATVSF